MNKMPFQPFNTVSISFYEDKTNSYPKNYSNQVVSFEEINNKLLTNLTIHNNDNNTKFVTLNFTPLYDIDYIYSLLKIGGAPTIEYRVIYFNGGKATN